MRLAALLIALCTIPAIAGAQSTDCRAIANSMERLACYLQGVDQDFTPTLPYAVIDNSLSSPPLQEQARDLLTAWGVL